jgi:Ran GTPase-activating protein (RanGAP) involved in mRNA processing and transport
LCQSKLDKQSVKLIGDLVNANFRLRELDLSWNQVSSLSNIISNHRLLIDVWELVQAIEYSKNLSFLNLSFNSFAGPNIAEIVDSICNFIRRNRSLQHLDLSYCGLKKD